jgi:UDP-N-acetylglucosamine--N-acetylmuramyl-(pentapeptide) pyrophosphoryl-undecaprenol N-acetylglucosamine transferase
MRVIVTGGGTGGHIFPAIAACEAIKRAEPTSELLYIGGSSGMEKEIVPAAGIPFHAVTARKMPASPSFNTIRGYGALIKGYAEARTQIRAFRPDVLLGTGGYVAAATVAAAARLGVPTVIMENNFVPGRANLRLAAAAKTICVSFKETMYRFPPGRCVLTGLPLRQGIVAPASLSKQDARRVFQGLDSKRFTILVIGGSQGARAINKLIAGAAPALISTGIQFLHQVGPKNADEAAAAAETAELTCTGSGYVMRPFISSNEMPAALRSADIIVCRGGISTISEATANGLPAFIIPLPTAYADHQTANGNAIEALGAAICRAESSLDSKIFADEIVALRMNPERLEAIASASLRAGRPNAADEVAKIVLDMKNCI